jgi:elongator complex protein 4
MSSFKRKAISSPTTPHGCKRSPAGPQTVITSTGIPSLDDILGGGLPLSCTQLILAPDLHSAYDILVQKYFVAQGLISGHRLCVIFEDAEEFVKECMWTPGNSLTTASASHSSASGMDPDDDDNTSERTEEKIKIAWRYEHMKQFSTTVSSDNQCVSFVIS